MSKEYGYIGKEVTQAFRDNKGIFTPQDIIELDQENKWTNFGQLELIKTVSVSNTGLNLDLTDIKEDVYDVHLLILHGVFFAGTNKLPRMRLSNDGGSTFEAGTNYVEAYQSIIASTFAEVKSTGQGYFNLMNNVGNEATEIGNSYTYLYNLGDSTKYTYCTYHSATQTSGGTYNACTFGSGLYKQYEKIDAIRIFEATASFNITGTASLYGVRSF